MISNETLIGIRDLLKAIQDGIQNPSQAILTNAKFGEEESDLTLEVTTVRASGRRYGRHIRISEKELTHAKYDVGERIVQGMIVELNAAIERDKTEAQ